METMISSEITMPTVYLLTDTKTEKEFIVINGPGGGGAAIIEAK
jgi:hypothetical protein